LKQTIEALVNPD